MKQKDWEDLGTRFLFHIGYPRTGTTFLQKHIFPQYSSEAILYSEKESLGLPKITKFFVHEEEFKKGKTYFLSNPNLSDYLIREQRNQKKPIIYSSEALSGDEYHDYYHVPGRIHHVFPKCKIIVCIRSQFTMIPSLYSYAYIKNGGTLSYESYMKQLFLTKKLNYYKLIRKYMDLFGFDSIYVAFYEELKANPDRFLCNLFNFVELPKKWELENNNQFKNPRFPMIVLKGSRIMNILLEIRMTNSLLDRFFLGSDAKSRIRVLSRSFLAIADKLYSKLSYSNTRTFEDNKKVRNLIANHYKYSNRKLFHLLKCDPGKYDYPI